MKTNLNPLSKFFPLTLAMLLTATGATYGQVRWSSYDTSGNLVTANVATGGDALSGGTVTFTVPANTQLSFVTKNFLPINLAAANARRYVTFNVSVSAGWGGVAARTMGWGLFNSAGTAGFTDDVGYFGLWNGIPATPLIETYDHQTGNGNLFVILPANANKLGQGTANSGTPTDGLTYTNQVLLVMNGAQTGISLGTSSSTLAAAGLAVNGPGVAHRVFTNPVIPVLGGATNMDEFAFMFNNTTASSVTVTLSSLGLGSSLTWDASGLNPVAPTDGSGNWASTNLAWSSFSADNNWLPGYNAIIGANNGAAGTITISETAGVTVSNITVNPASSGNYTISGGPLNFAGKTITVASGVNATIGSIMTGNGFTKEGPGSLFLNQGANNTFTGDVVINNGLIQPGSTAGRFYIPGNLVINTNGSFVAVSGGVGSGVFGTGVMVLNGQNPGNTNVFVNSGAWISAGTLVLANGAVITNAGGGISGTYAVTNSDARSGQVWLTRHGFGITNIIAKSTPGSVIISTRPNGSATDGYVATLNAGALIFDYAFANNAAVKLKTSLPLTFAGGMLVFSNSAIGLAPSANSPNATFFNSGASSLFSTNAGASGGNVAFGTITRKAGATFNLVKTVGPGAIGSASFANVNGIVGGWNTYNLTDWTAGTSTWAPLAGGSYTTSADPTTWAAANNVSLSGSTSPNVPDLTSINTLRLTAASTVTLDGSLTLSSGGLLVTGSGATAFTGGTLKGASGIDLIIHQNASADLTINSTLADNGTATSLTKDGVGKVIIAGSDTMSGTNFLNGGTVEVSDLAKLASGPLDMNGGTLRYTGSDTTSSRAVVTRGLGPTFDIVGGTKVTQSGAIIGSGDVLGDFGGLTKSGNGTLILSASNYYNGETIVSGGVLAINGTNACNSTVWDAGRISVFATLGGNGVVSGPVSVKNGGTIAPGNSIGTLTVANSLTLEGGSTSSFEVTNDAAGDLLVVQGNLNIQSNATIAITILGTPLQLTTNTLITYTGAKVGSFNPTVVVNGSLNGSVTLDESTPGQIKLAIIPQVAITGQPADTIVSVGGNPSFTVTATGLAPLSYQWFYYGNNINNPPVGLTDQTNSTFSIINAQTADSGYYSVTVSNAFNAVSSRQAQLIVGDVAPVIAGPTNKVVIVNNNITFNTTVLIANPFPAFQWKTNGTDVPGATGLSVTFNNVQFSMDGVIVSVVATNVAGSATNSAILNVVVPPSITLNPTNLTVNVGDTAVFSGSGAGVPAPSLQWYKNGVAISGQTGTTLTILNAQGSNIANYTLVASNVVGVATSSPAKLTVISTNLASTAVNPVNGGSGINYDTPLYITFNAPVSVVNSGRVRIFNVNSPTPVDTIDMVSNTVVISGGILVTNNIQGHSPFSGDTAQAVRYFPVIVTGSTAAIYPHSGVMTSNQTYYVLIDNGVVKDSAGAYFTGITDTNAWKFSTKVGGPANPTNLVIATDNSGDFATVQGAVDYIPAGNNNLVLVNIRNGIYTELVNISGKSNITFRGQSRTNTQIGYPNCDNINPGTAPRSAFKVNGADIKFNNLTIFNSTPQGGSQAEALLIYNAGFRCVVDNCDIVSRQDTILINAGGSQGYFNNCKVIGNFDYVWGSGVGFFTNCVFHTITNILSGTYNLTAARTITSAALSTATPWVNPNGTTFSANGFSFVYCTLEADAGLTNISLAGNNGTAGGLDSWALCKIDNTAYVNPATALTNLYVFWQFQNTNLAGTTPVTYSNLQTVPSAADPRMVAALSVSNWFSGWIPLSGNHAPVAAASTYARNAGFSLKIAIPGSLASNWSDSDGDTVTLTGAISSTNGATVSYDANFIYYSSPNDTADEIDYTISDGHGATAAGAISVTIASASTNQSANIVGQNLNGDGSVTINFAGIPNYTYWVQATTNLFTPDWLPISTNVAGPNGLWNFTDTNATNFTQRYYRSYKP